MAGTFLALCARQPEQQRPVAVANPGTFSLDRLFLVQRIHIG
jgi:hypothetical protein